MQKGQRGAQRFSLRRFSAAPRPRSRLPLRALNSTASRLTPVCGRVEAAGAAGVTAGASAGGTTVSAGVSAGRLSAGVCSGVPGFVWVVVVTSGAASVVETQP